MRRCLHIFLSNITPAQSRLYKEASYVLKSKILDEVFVLGLWHEGAQLEEDDPSGIKIIRKKTLVRELRNAWFFKKIPFAKKFAALVSLFQYVLSAVMLAHRLRPDHVTCHNAVMLPVAWAAARVSGASLEYLPHELEAHRTGLSGLEKWITTHVERLFIRSSRNVVVVCDPIRDWYEDTYGLTNVHVVRNVPEKDAVQIHPIPEGGFRERFGIPDGVKVFIYQGLLSAGRGVEILIDTFAAIDPARCHLVFMGYGEDCYQAKIDDAARKHTNIHYQPAVPREWIVSYSAGADVGILITESNSLSYKYSLPNKFFEWAHAGLPILLGENLEYQAQIVRENGTGWVTSKEDLKHTIDGITPDIVARYAEKAKEFARSAVWENDAAIFARVYSK